MRIKVLACLVGEGGLDVVLSDNDALWMKSPLEDLNALQGDILAQRGDMPHPFSDPLFGVTICPGFAMFCGGSKDMPILLNKWLQLPETIGDDQGAVDRAACPFNMIWAYEEGGLLNEGTRTGKREDLTGRRTAIPARVSTVQCPILPETPSSPFGSIVLWRGKKTWKAARLLMIVQSGRKRELCPCFKDAVSSSPPPAPFDTVP